MPQAKIGVIGGSGLYEMEGLTDIQEVKVSTPFGDPSDVITIGRLEEVPIAFLPRHGRGHRLLPTEVPSQANIYALKTLGVEWVISISAVGSLKEEIEPLHLVIPDQIIDRTKSRCNTFFGNGLVAHVGFADPFCHVLSDILHKSAQEAGARVHKGGTYVAMEGPLFSTRAESNLYRSWGASIIGMTALPEAKLAREAEICYATVACVTDYDCWHQAEETVTVDMIIANLLRNVDTAKRIIRLAAAKVPGQRACECATALKTAIITRRDLIPERVKQDLKLLVGKYLGTATNLQPQKDTQEAVKEGLLQFGSTLRSGGSFTRNQEADRLLRSDPFAFLLAASLDRGSRAEFVWEIPWQLKEKLGHLDPVILNHLSPEDVENELRRLPRKPRFPNQAGKTIVSLAKLVSDEFGGDAATVWGKKPVITVLSSLQRIYGVGPGIAHMTVRILIDEGYYRPVHDELREIDVKPDTQVTRVFYRSGLSPTRDWWSCIEAARRLYPEFPGKLDWPAWEIGRRYCHESGPNCRECPIGGVCAKVGI